MTQQLAFNLQSGGPTRRRKTILKTRDAGSDLGQWLSGSGRFFDLPRGDFQVRLLKAFYSSACFYSILRLILLTPIQTS